MGEVVWSDEKLITIETAHNRQNDRVVGNKSSDIPSEQKRVCYTMKPPSVMVWPAISSTWKSSLIFMKSNRKIHAKYYIKLNCTSIISLLKPMAGSAKNYFGKEQPLDLLTWWNDSVNCEHHTNLVQRSFGPVLDQRIRPPCSPDLHPMDFSVRSILEAKACSTIHNSFCDLMSSFTLFWDEIPQDMLRAAVSSAVTDLRL